MATPAATLIQRTRRFLGDWPENDVSTASITNNGVTLTVADSTLYTSNWLIQLDNEGMQVRATPTPTTVTLLRAARGTTGASHVSGSTILINPRFLDYEYLDALNAGINACYPLLYQSVVDESVSTVDSTYEYTIPTLNGAPIPNISRLQFRETSDLAFRDFPAWDVLRGSAPKLKLRRPLPAGTLRIYGFGPLPALSSPTDTLSGLFPTYGEDALTLFAAQYLLASGEAARTRDDTGIRDDREAANRPGTSMSASNAIYGRFLARISSSAMPPMPKHTVTAL